LPIHNNLWCSASVATNARKTRRHRLKKDNTEAFLARGKSKGTGLSIQAAQFLVAHLTSKDNPIHNGVIARDGLKAFAVVAVTNDCIDSIRGVFQSFCE